MQVFAGENLATAVEVDVEIVSPGVGKIVCLECDGDPEGYPSLFPPEIGVTQCIDCKGRGWIYISA